MLVSAGVEDMTAREKIGPKRAMSSSGPHLTKA